MLTRASSALVLLAMTAAAASVFACNSGADALTTRRGSTASRTDTGATAGDGGTGDGTPEKALFDKVYPDLTQHCANGCHDTATSAAAPKFLAGPDPYTSLKTHAGVITGDVYSSILLTKGPHMGPAVSSLPDMQTRLIDWLNAEAAILTSVALPTTPAFTVVNGTNTVDLTPAAKGLTGVGLRFDAALISGMLQLTNITVTTTAGSDVHVLQPKFVRVAAGKDVDDPADSFSNADQTITAGQEAILSPGQALFSAPSWRPFDLANDKLRIEMTKLEVGKQNATQADATCKNANAFKTNVLPQLRQTQAQNGTCVSCHADGRAGMSLASNDAATVCAQVLGKLDKTDITKSLLLTHLSGGPNITHGGGPAVDFNTFQQLITSNSGVFF